MDMHRKIYHTKRTIKSPEKEGNIPIHKIREAVSMTNKPSELKRPEILNHEETIKAWCKECWGVKEASLEECMRVCTYRLTEAERLKQAQLSHDISHYEALIPNLVEEAKREVEQQLLDSINKEIFNDLPDCWGQAKCGTDCCYCDYSQWKQLLKKHGIGE
jgi:hypothetical protein